MLAAYMHSVRNGVDLVEQALQILDALTLLLDVTGVGPNAALKMLDESLPESAVDRQDWVWRARVAAVMGSCPKTIASIRAGASYGTKVARGSCCGFMHRLQELGRLR